MEQQMEHLELETQHESSLWHSVRRDMYLHQYIRFQTRAHDDIPAKIISRKTRLTMRQRVQKKRVFVLLARLRKRLKKRLRFAQRRSAGRKGIRKFATVLMYVFTTASFRDRLPSK